MIFFYLKVHFDLRESIVISSKTNFVIPTTVQISEAHFVHSLFCACAYVGNVHGSPESLRGRSVGENSCKNEGNVDRQTYAHKHIGDFFYFWPVFNG